MLPYVVFVGLVLMEIEAKSPSVRSHIENCSLLSVASGESMLQEWEQNHFHVCELCKGVFYILVEQLAAKRGNKTAGGAA
jgi:hypothetical protein